MNRFAALLDRLAFEHGRNNKIRLMTEYFRVTPDPERGWALAALTGALTFQHAKPGIIRALIAERTDPVLFGLSWDYVGDLSETVALLWLGESEQAPISPRGEPQVSPRGRSAPSPLVEEGWGGGSSGGASDRTTPTPNPSPQEPATGRTAPAARPDGGGEPKQRAPLTPTLSEVVTALATLSKADLPGRLAQWLDRLDETGRWALLKLVTGALRIGVSARLAKTAVAALGNKDPDEIELVWPGLWPPYTELFAWVEGRAERPQTGDPAPFRPVMLAHAIEAPELPALDPAAYLAEWKWDGIRVQAVAGTHADGRRAARLYSRAGEDISPSFPDLIDALSFTGAIDGELLVVRHGRVQNFNILQQRLNRKTVTPKLLADYPAHLRAYDLIAEGAEDLRERPFAERRARLEALVRHLGEPRIDLSPLVPFATWGELAAARADPAAVGTHDADAVEGVMLKRRDAPYLPGRPKGHWWKWKRDPFIVDAVLMYAARGSGKRSSFYSDYTFGVWRAGEDGDELVPVGKAYFGFTDAELLEIDRFVRRHTIERFGPVREVVHEPDKGLVLEVAFEGLQRSTRHKSGLAMRFPRISRLRWDKPPAEADRIETLERMLENVEARGHGSRGKEGLGKAAE
jgi:DNA ligase 1